MSRWVWKVVEDKANKAKIAEVEIKGIKKREKFKTLIIEEK